MLKSENIQCPLLNKKIDEGYCWELRNIGTNDVLLEGDNVSNWDEAFTICQRCGRYEESDE